VVHGIEFSHLISITLCSAEYIHVTCGSSFSHIRNDCPIKPFKDTIWKFSRHRESGAALSHLGYVTLGSNRQCEHSAAALESCTEDEPESGCQLVPTRNKDVLKLPTKCKYFPEKVSPPRNLLLAH
jgi:hypothetical protein